MAEVTPEDAAAAQQTRLPAPAYTPEDRFFGPAFIDIDEWRETPVRFRYLHGGFEGTDTRFSFYLPERPLYRRRFFQTLQGGVGGNERTVLDAIAAYDQFGVVPPLSLLAAFDNGAYLIESNQGHFPEDMTGVGDDQSILCWRASAETARYGRIVARRLLGSAPRRGYLFGGSGGSARTMNCLEEVEGLWDGAAPFITPSESTGTFFSLQANAVRLLGRDNLARVDDAVEVGGSGNPFEGLSGPQAAALQILYQSGFPRRIGVGNPAEAVYVWSQSTAYSFAQFDPEYFSDFWNRPGYLGCDDPQSLESARVLVSARVTRVLSGQELRDYRPTRDVVDETGMGDNGRARIRGAALQRPMGLLIDGGAEHLPRMGCSNITFDGGAAAGRNRFVMGVIGDALMIGGLGAELLEGVQVGDQVTIDNSNYLAFCYHYQYQADARFREWRHSLLDDRLIFVRRPTLLKISSKYPLSYDFGDRKMIMVANLLDRGAFPSAAAGYRDRLRATRGEAFDRSNYRIWYNDHAWHGTVTENLPNDSAPVLTTKLIDYQGAVHRALKALVRWVEQGEEPPRNTTYDYTLDCDIRVPASAAERGGVQPVVSITGNGASGRVEIAAGQSVSFAAVAEAPPGTGTFVSAEWDFDGAGTWPQRHAEIDGRASRLELRASHTYERPGTYFACLRVATHPEGAVDNPLYKLPNLARIRVVVS